ncbi:MAG TPA: FkbM family methyltransferase [Candidatus Saccharimonadales bacterium]|nr:FkbM family methyltransferase [Candidatus Saccharimonadales bacterium]
MKSYSQAGQDVFVLSCLKKKRGGYFLEIGSNHPMVINNSYQLEKDYDWKGIMIEYDSHWLPFYQQERQKSHYLIQDATTIDYKALLTQYHAPQVIDYLQIDLEVNNYSTLKTLELLNEQVMDDYQFAVITFEHDIYQGNYFNTREKSRDIFEQRGYIRVFSDVRNENNPFEDWYVYPDLVDMTYINHIKRDDSLEYTDILNYL